MKKIIKRKAEKITSYENLPLIMTVGDVQSALRVSKPNAYKIMSTGGFPKMRIGKRVLVEKEAFKNWLVSISM